MSGLYIPSVVGGGGFSPPTAPPNLSPVSVPHAGGGGWGAFATAALQDPKIQQMIMGLVQPKREAPQFAPAPVPMMQAPQWAAPIQPAPSAPLPSLFR